MIAQSLTRSLGTVKRFYKDVMFDIRMKSIIIRVDILILLLGNQMLETFTRLTSDRYFEELDILVNMILKLLT